VQIFDRYLSLVKMMDDDDDDNNSTVEYDEVFRFTDLFLSSHGHLIKLDIKKSFLKTGRWSPVVTRKNLQTCYFYISNRHILIMFSKPQRSTQQPR